MRAITIQNPYALVVAHNLKGVENRGSQVPWSAAIGELVAIHAGRTLHPHGMADPRIERALLHVFPDHPHDVHTIRGWDRFLHSTVLPHLRELAGKVVAVRRLLDVHDPQQCPSRHGGTSWTTARCDGWAELDQWHLVFEPGSRLATPVPCRGFLGLWSLPADVEAAVRAQVALAGAR
jgi:hypothetical protein